MRLLVVAVLTVAGAFGSAVAAQSHPSFLKPSQGALRGTYQVFEDRAAKRGRKIGLNIVVLRATGDEPRPDPVFWIAGGPGQAATSLARRLARS